VLTEQNALYKFKNSTPAVSLDLLHN